MAGVSNLQSAIYQVASFVFHATRGQFFYLSGCFKKFSFSNFFTPQYTKNQVLCRKDFFEIRSNLSSVLIAFKLLKTSKNEHWKRYFSEDKQRKNAYESLVVDN